MNATKDPVDGVNMGLGDGLVPSSSKLLPEPMLTKFYDAL